MVAHLLQAAMIEWQKMQRNTDTTFFPVDMEPVLPRLLFLGEKSVFLYCFCELLWQHLFV